MMIPITIMLDMCTEQPEKKIKIFKDSSDEESQNMSDDGIPPTKRTKTL